MIFYGYSPESKGTPPMLPPTPENRALLGPDWWMMVIKNPLIRAYFLIVPQFLIPLIVGYQWLIVP